VMVASHSSTETIVVPSRTEVVRAVVLEAALWGGGVGGVSGVGGVGGSVA
jgi:hypothetical protein